MPEVFVGAGSNALPVPRLRLAAAELARRFGRVESSSVYRSAAVGGPAPDYLNLVFRFATELPITALESALREIEAAAGRTRDGGRECALDLDLLLYGERVDAAVRLPHRDVVRRAFVLAPLAELAPERRDPLGGETFGAAAARLAMRGAGLERLGALEGLPERE